MTTHRAIVDALFSSAESGESVVLATVVRITGSSYGGVGTRMVARVDGSTVGIVSGGCLEADLAEHARQVDESRVARVVTYDTRADDDTAWGLGLGCNGLIEVLLEPLSPSEATAVGRLIEAGLAAREPRVMATVISSRGEMNAPTVGAHALFSTEALETAGDWGDRMVLELARIDAGSTLGAGRRGTVKEYDRVEVAFEIVKPAVRLVVCGTGPDVLPLVQLGRQLGWNLTVIDNRSVIPEHQARFPGATLIECAEPRKLAESIAISEATAAVVMSHHYARDLEYVRALIASDATYIGVLGPQGRADRMASEMTVDERSRAEGRVFAPVGLDLGGDGAEAIALSIIAEAAAVIASRDGRHLRDRKAPLH